jgi:hypothetical protein
MPQKHSCRLSRKRSQVEIRRRRRRRVNDLPRPKVRATALEATNVGASLSHAYSHFTLAAILRWQLVS